MSSPATPTAPTTARKPEGAPWAKKFVDRIHRACEFPGQRAALRSGLRREVDDSPRMHAIVATLVPQVDRGNESRERAWYAVAAMIASLPRAARRTRAEEPDDAETAEDTGGAQPPEVGDGATAAPQLRRRRRDLGVCLAEAVGRRTIRDTTAETRLDLLCRQSVDGLHRHLPATVRQLAVTPDAVDWVTLLRDLRAWEDHREEIARRWLQSYYRVRFTAERERARKDDDQENQDATGSAPEPGPATDDDRDPA
ncbi:type I-E CRISPR-associated protein Cse2/CasB [Embleya sp. NPDC008237]|uniref:type I-E CRISPR-associated protein Cse2/CasB n=1 Tax=Embleya sp. NPDC008237 TaxID=3363978 RepID=UPI0036E87FD4